MYLIILLIVFKVMAGPPQYYHNDCQNLSYYTLVFFFNKSSLECQKSDRLFL